MLKFRKATLKDIPQMQKIIQQEIRDGIILQRSDDEVAMNIRSYILCCISDELIGYGALHIHSSTLAEIRSLVTNTPFRGRGVGSSIVKRLIQEAKELHSKRVLVLTYLPEFFKRLKFEEIPKESIPEHKIWTDCIKCIHFPLCNETSLIYDVEQEI